MNDNIMSGLGKIKNMFTGEDKKKNIMITAIAPLVTAGLVGGSLLLRKKLKAPIKKWDPSSFIDEVTTSIMKGVKS